jgi:tyrosyl-tRNA synthetase
VGWSATTSEVRMGRLLVQLGLADSGADATRKVKQGAVRVGGEIVTAPAIAVTALPATLVVRVGKRMRAALLQ